MATAKKTLADLRAVHDKSVVIPARIKKALAAMAAIGPEQWEYDLDFLKLAGISTTDAASYRDLFVDFWAMTPATNGKSSAKRVWFATKKAADAWKDI